MGSQLTWSAVARPPPPAPAPRPASTRATRRPVLAILLLSNWKYMQIERKKHTVSSLISRLLHILNETLLTGFIAYIQKLYIFGNPTIRILCSSPWSRIGGSYVYDIEWLLMRKRLRLCCFLASRCFPHEAGKAERTREPS